MRIELQGDVFLPEPESHAGAVFSRRPTRRWRHNQQGAQVLKNITALFPATAFLASTATFAAKPSPLIKQTEGGTITKVAEGLRVLTQAVQVF
jgi:hypothetical protein